MTDKIDITVTLECTPEQLKKVAQSLFDETSWGTVIEIARAECVDEESSLSETSTESEKL